MRLLPLSALCLACRPPVIVQDTGALQPPCDPSDTRFVMPVDPGNNTVGVEHHLGLCSDRNSTMGRLAMRRTLPDATCVTTMTFTGVGEEDCPGCEGAWAIEDAFVDSDCDPSLADLAPGPEDLEASPWIGWSLDGTLHGEGVVLPAVSYDYAKKTEGPNEWIDVYGAGLFDR